MLDDSSPSGTRADLIAAGLHLFGHDGFAATSTRALAARAGTNVASIAYHFGGKDGLRMACAEEVLRRITAVAGAPAEPPQMPPDEALGWLDTMLRALVGFLTQAPQAADIVGFMLREMAEDGPGLALIYESFFRHKHRELCRLIAMVTGGDPDSQSIRLLAFSLMGQAIYFRIGQPIVCRRMEWPQYGEAESRAIADRLSANLHAILRAEK
ncbi:CerR family C-terminal domain-containing protein [Paracoccus lutimaris]|uniref:TetR family transcriptional regulator n=1 Tax=Paracoccus lutimaris TaxID=1490030 RepID=A0A368YHE4_9RHOB|nr:CerR family C-terminal domain-containing protein [Paracoccus lutimaris]RCW79641.1 TetR family transcriptional regulator [Paracoccus lutimaris]